MKSAPSEAYNHWAVSIWLVYVINFSESYEMCARGNKIIDLDLARIRKIKMVSSPKIIHLRPRANVETVNVLP